MAERKNSRFTDKTLLSRKTLNLSSSSCSNIAKVSTYLKQGHSVTNTCVHKQSLSQRVYNPKKKKRQIPLYRSGLRSERIYVAEERNGYILSPSSRHSACDSPLRSSTTRPTAQMASRYKRRATPAPRAGHLRTLPASAQRKKCPTWSRAAPRTWERGKGPEPVTTC